MSTTKRIIIANSVGIDNNGWAIIHSPSRWTNSSKDKNIFTYYPWELAYTSSLLKKQTNHEVLFIDGCLDKLTVDAFFERIVPLKPDYLVMEPATRTWPEDSELMRRVKEACGTHIIVVGQHATAFSEEVSTVADYVAIGEYEYTVLDIVQGKERKSILGLYPNERRPLLDVNSLPWPEDSDVSRLRYGIPGEPSSEYLEIQAYATRGCPMNCSFCVCRHMYYAKPNWRPRDPKDVVAELLYLRKRYPQMEGIFFDEEFHNVQKKFILDLSKEIIAAGLNDLKIEAMCAYYTLDEEMMDAMKRAGYYLLRVGIETAGDGSAKGINLGVKFNLEKLRRVLRYAKTIGLKMYGTFTFGSPGSSREDDQKTLDLMDEIIREGLLWRFQTSICTPQPGTPFYDWAKDQGFIKTHEAADYDGGNTVVLEYPNYKREEIMEMYQKAQVYYDYAVANRFNSRLNESIKALKKIPCESLLILRTSRMPQMEATMRALKEAKPNLQIDVLAQNVVKEEISKLQKEGLIRKSYWYDQGFFKKENLSLSFKKEIQAKDYDAVCIVYNNLKGRGYENVESFVNELAIERWILFNSEGFLIPRDELNRMRDAEKEVCECELNAN